MDTSDFIINTPGGLVDFTEPKIMGIVNLTPDSFYENSRVSEITHVVDRVGLMIKEGADIIDLGAASTRPGASKPSISEELDRLIAPLMAVRAAFPDVLISIDTFRTEILKACFDLRIDMINDVSGGEIDEGFLEQVAKMNLPYILMHMKGNPGNMQDNPKYEDVVLDLMKYFDARIHYCHRLGIQDIIIDPGFGFGKSIDDNYKLLGHLSSFRIFNLPILVGVSRKSMIYELLKIPAKDGLNGTTALHMLALQNGAKILRTHDVFEAKQCIQLWTTYKSNSSAT